MRTIRIGFFILLVSLKFFHSYGQERFVKGNPALAYWQIGNKAETVIVIHGGPAIQHEYLRPEFDALSKVARVIYYDQRVCGKSQRAASYLWQDHVNDLKRVIEQVAKNKKVFLAGSSWGSTLAMIYAYKHPEAVKGLILSGTYGWEGAEGTYQRKLKYATYPPYHLRLDEQRIVSQVNEEGQLTEKVTHISKSIENVGGTVKEETRESFITAPRIDSLRNVTVPVLIFNGSRDCGIDQGHVHAALFPKAELYTIAGACHDPWFSNPDLFLLYAWTLSDIPA